MSKAFTVLILWEQLPWRFQMPLLINSTHFPHVYLFQYNKFGAYLNQSLKFSYLPELAMCLSMCTVSAGFLLGLMWGTRVQVHPQTRTHLAIKIFISPAGMGHAVQCQEQLHWGPTPSLTSTKIIQLHSVIYKNCTLLTSLLLPGYLVHYFEAHHITATQDYSAFSSVVGLSQTQISSRHPHYQTAPQEISAMEPKVRGVSSSPRYPAATQSHC